MSTFLCSLRPDPAAAWGALPSPSCGHRRRGRSPALTDPRVLSPVLRWGSAGAGAWGLLAVGAPRDQSCARRERWGQLGLRAVARGGSGCRRSYARSVPIPLPPGAPSGIHCVAKNRSLSTGWGWVPSCVLDCTGVRGKRQLGPTTRIRILTTDPGVRQGHGFRVTLSGRNPMEGVNEHGIHAGPFIGPPVAGLSAMPVPHP